MTAREKRNTLLRNTSMTLSQISSDVSCRGPACDRFPALLTSMSTRPKVARVACTARCTSASSVTLLGTASACPPAAAIWSATSSSSSLRRPVIVTLAPSCANVRAMAAPMPVPPPVTMVTLSASRMDVSLSGLNDRLHVSSSGGRCGWLVHRQARHDRLVNRRRDAVLDSATDDGAAQRVDLETAALFEIAGHRRSPWRRECCGLGKDRIDSGRLKVCAFGLRHCDDFRACGAEEAATRRARDQRADARACERRHATDARDEQKLIPQHAPDVGRDLMRNATLSEGSGDPLDPFGQDPAELAEDHPAFAAHAKNDAGTGELERDIDSA